MGPRGRTADALRASIDTPLGVVPTVFWYTALTVRLALVSLAAQLLLKRSARGVAGFARPSESVAGHS
jgi:hypothetical protein